MCRESIDAPTASAHQIHRAGRPVIRQAGGLPLHKKGRPNERPFQLPQTPGQAVAGAVGFAFAAFLALIATFLRLM
jgi:hypothetical protein